MQTRSAVCWTCQPRYLYEVTACMIAYIGMVSLPCALIVCLDWERSSLVPVQTHLGQHIYRHMEQAKGLLYRQIFFCCISEGGLFTECDKLGGFDFQLTGNQKYERDARVDFTQFYPVYSAEFKLAFMGKLHL